MGEHSSGGTTDPFAVRPAEPDGAGARTSAFVLFAAAVAINAFLLLLSFHIPALLWCRLLAACTLGSIAGSAIWPSRRKDWHGGPDTNWLLSVSAWALAFATGGLAIAVLDM